MNSGWRTVGGGWLAGVEGGGIRTTKGTKGTKGHREADGDAYDRFSD